MRCSRVRTKVRKLHLNSLAFVQCLSLLQFPSTSAKQSCCNKQSISILFGRLVSRIVLTPALNLLTSFSRHAVGMLTLCLPLAFTFFWKASLSLFIAGRSYKCSPCD